MIFFHLNYPLFQNYLSISSVKMYINNQEFIFNNFLLTLTLLFYILPPLHFSLRIAEEF